MNYQVIKLDDASHYLKELKKKEIGIFNLKQMVFHLSCFFVIWYYEKWEHKRHWNQ